MQSLRQVKQKERLRIRLRLDKLQCVARRHRKHRSKRPGKNLKVNRSNHGRRQQVRRRRAAKALVPVRQKELRTVLGKLRSPALRIVLRQRQTLRLKQSQARRKNRQISQISWLARGGSVQSESLRASDAYKNSSERKDAGVCVTQRLSSPASS